MSNQTEVMVGFIQLRLDLSWGCDNFMLDEAYCHKATTQ